MIINWLQLPNRWLLTWNISAQEWIYFALLAVAVLIFFNRYKTSPTRFTSLQWAVTVGLSASGFLTSAVSTLSLPSSIPILTFTTPLLYLLPTLIAAVWIGPWPALFVSAASGIGVAGLISGRPSQILEIVVASLLMISLLSQRYEGRIGFLLRQPIAASIISTTFILWPLGLVGEIVANPLPLFSSIDVAAARLWPTLIGLSLLAITSATPVHLAMMLRPLQETISKEMPPWERHLDQRLFYLFVPLMASVIVILVGIVSVTSYGAATRIVTDQLRKDASNANSAIPFYIQTGRSLIRSIAESERLASTSIIDQENALAEGALVSPFFEQIAFVDQTGIVRASYPPDSISEITSPDEQTWINLALTSDAPGEFVSFSDEHTIMTFVAPVKDKGNRSTIGALIGRTRLARNPTFAPALSAFQNAASGSGEGLLIDSLSRILVAPTNPALAGTVFDISSSSVLQAGTSSSGAILQQRLPDGTSNLIVAQPVTGQSDWSVIFLAPNSVAIALAVQIAFPLLIALLLIGLLLVPLIRATSRRLTIPLGSLLQATEEIARGNLGYAIHAQGQDEIGRLSQSFEEMRSSLKERLEEQEFLLRISRSVSGSLELFRVLPTILASVLDAGHSSAARIVLRRGSDETFETYVVGDVSGLSSLDKQLMDLTEKQGTVVISRIERAPALDTKNLPATVKALVALPLRSESSFHGILWAAYPEEHDFKQSELDFLSTVASQAAIAVANARLLAEAQEGQRKLEAVLESVTDGMIAVDNQGRITVMNPVTEELFGVRFEKARGKAANQIVDIPDLAQLLTDLREPVVSLEILNKDSKVLLANTSTILGHDGAISGRVTVLRDITALKELDNIKTVFLRMVSHDLRSPLTYMRGYLSMMPLSGSLNERQLEALDKINNGIDHISEMTERLLYLSRLKFGDEAELEFSLVDVGDILQEIEDEQVRFADDKNIDLIVETNEKLPLLYVDGMLFHQAISNLVSNAIKYTTEGGKVTAKAFLDDMNQVTVLVTDTGIGIRDEDQTRLFEAFYRVPQREGEAARPRGAGLGLALVKAIADAHKGTVRVNSKHRQGSEFQISFPIRQPDEV